jgi:hypothetical protein
LQDIQTIIPSVPAACVVDTGFCHDIAVGFDVDALAQLPFDRGKHLRSYRKQVMPAVARFLSCSLRNNSVRRFDRCPRLIPVVPRIYVYGHNTVDAHL